jgi:hypothetical protein
LRGAITQANADADPLSTINFNIPGSGTQTISLGSALPAVTHPVAIDATTQPGYSGMPVIVLDGTNAGTGTSGIDLTAQGSGSTVKGFVVEHFGGNAIEIDGSGNNVIASNFIGVDATGSGAAGNGEGIVVNNSSGNTIGGNTAAARNIISGNSSTAIDLSGSGTTANRVEGNFIGTDSGGTIAIGNGSLSSGNLGAIYISAGANGNIIGGTNADTRNVISGNWRGVFISGAGTSGNVVEGNYLGTTASGLAALGNQGDAVLISFSASGNTVGGGAPGAGNVIAGGSIGSYGVTLGYYAAGNWVAGNLIGTDATGQVNLGFAGSAASIIEGAHDNIIGTNSDGVNDATEGNIIVGSGLSGEPPSLPFYGGVELDGPGVSNNIIAGNDIGTNGVVAMPNAYGVALSTGATDNTIGGTTAVARNIISGNQYAGVLITGNLDITEPNYWTAGPVTGNVVEGDFIGTDPTGSTPLGNAGAGIVVTAGAVGNTIGGTAPGARNLISGNAGDGIDLTGSGTTGNVVAGNLIGTNADGTAGLGAPNAYGFSDVVSGQVSLNIPQLSTNPGDVTTFSFWMDWAGPSYPDQFPIGFADTHLVLSRGSYVGFGNLSSESSAPNQYDLFGAYSPDSADHWVFVTAIIANGAPLAQDQLWIDGVQQSLGLVYPTGAPVSFNVSTAVSIGSDMEGHGVSAALDDVAFFNRQLTPTEIQAEYASRLDDTLNTTILSQGPVACYPLDETGGTVAHDTSGNGNDGTIDASVTPGIPGGPTGNQDNGISISSGASGNTIGGTAPGAPNVISGNNRNGVVITDSGTSANVVENDIIGLDASGTKAIPNPNDGVLVTNGGSGNVIGDATGGTRNIISGNRNNGVEISGVGTSANQVVGDIIGLDVTGETVLGTDGESLRNCDDGVVVQGGAANNAIGGLTNTPGVGAGNVISGNNFNPPFVDGPFAVGTSGSGVLIRDGGSSGNVVEGNIIGLDATGTHSRDANGVPLGNAGGVAVLAASNNTIGGTVAGARNIISNNVAT